jgi:hypothetical protein
MAPTFHPALKTRTDAIVLSPEHIGKLQANDLQIVHDGPALRLSAIELHLNSSAFTAMLKVDLVPLPNA